MPKEVISHRAEHLASEASPPARLTLLVAMTWALFVLCLPATAQVSVANGQPSYAIGIKVPPGPAGMTPSVGLAYSNGRAGTGVGFGWTLVGFSLISRCPPMRSLDGDEGAIRFDANDKLCLDGRRLIQTDGMGESLPFPQAADSAGLAAGDYREYRVENDPKTRIRAYGTAGGSTSFGPAYFRVWLDGGRVRTYGNDPALAFAANSTLVAGTGQAHSWGLSRDEDANTNRIDYAYDRREIYARPSGLGDAIEWVISRVDYGANSVAGTPNAVTLTFRYEDDPYPDTAWLSAKRRIYQRRLVAIEATVIGQPGITSTRLSYESRGTTQRSLLSSVSQCARANAGAAEACLPATRFKYTENTSSDYIVNNEWTRDKNGQPNGLDAVTLMWSKAATGGVLLGDFNGDGRTDILLRAWKNRIFLSEGVGNYREILPGSDAGYFNLSNVLLSTSDNLSIEQCRVPVVADFDGDGLDDLAVISTITPGLYGCDTSATSKIYRSNGDGSFATQTVRSQDNGVSLALRRFRSGVPTSTTDGIVHVMGYGNFWLADFNRDGRIDILSFDIEVGRVRPGGPAGSAGLVCEIEYDGQPRRCNADLWLGGGDGTFTRTKPKPFNAAGETWVPYIPYGSAYSHLVGDVDGDGVPDLFVPKQALYFWDGVYQYWSGGYLMGKQSGDFYSTSRTHVQPGLDYRLIGGDFNGDGIADIVATSYINPVIMNYGSGDSFGYRSVVLSGTYVTPGVAADINGDGRTDILTIENAQPNRLYISSVWGNPIENGLLGEYQNTQIRNTVMHLVLNEGNLLEDARVRSVFGNFSGSGLFEFLVLQSNPAGTPNRLYVRASGKPIDLLESVTSGDGAKTTLTYEAITRTSSYASDRGTAHAAQYPHSDQPARPVTTAPPSRIGAIALRDTTPPMFVVTSVTSDSGVGSATRTTRFAYRGFKSELLGRGSTGFREIRSEVTSADAASPITTVQQRLQSYPYIGYPSVSEAFVGALSQVGAPQTGQLLTRTENTYCDQTAAPGAEAAATLTTPCSSTSKIRRPYLYRSVHTGRDLDGSELPTTRTTTTYSGGYPTLIRTETTGAGPAGLQSFVKTQSFDYWPDNISGDNWLLGLVKKSTTTSTVPNSLGAISTSAGNAPKATATSGP